MTHLDIHIDTVGFDTVGPEWHIPHLPYPHHRLYYVSNGSANIMLSDSTLQLKEGHMYLIPAFTLTKISCKESLSHHFCHFRFNHKDIIDLFDIYHPPLDIPALGDAEQLFQALNRYYLENSLYASLIVNGSIQQLLAPFFKNCQRPPVEILRLEPVLSYIEENIDSKLPNRSLAEILQLDTIYFTNLFSKSMGISPTQYIIKKRLAHAQTLLLSTDLKVIEIAALSGFDNPMYFSQLFKKRVGLTPLTYRNYSRQLNTTTIFAETHF